MNSSDYDIIASSKFPIKSWTKGVPVEEEAKRQLMNVANLPFIYKWLAVMPDVHLGKGATIGSVIATKKAIIPAAVGVDLGCFLGNTKIPLLDGTQATLLELSLRKEPFWVYSINKKMKIAPGRASCIKTRTNAELIRLIVSGGEEVICTPDQKYMLTDGSYREAKDLKFNDSLMPLYRRWYSRDGYEGINNGKGKRCITHIMVWESLKGPVPKGYVVHQVISVEYLSERDDVYCLRVEEYNNFAISAGVFVHNCGMMANRTNITANQLPDNLHEIRTVIETAVPHGRTNKGREGDRGAWYNVPRKSANFFMKHLATDFKKIIEKHPKIEKGNCENHLGTLGTGNHFIEMCLDEEDRVWIMLHSGSRGVGNRIGGYFINLAKEEIKTWHIKLTDQDLAYLSEGSRYFDDYVDAVHWAQKFAKYNRQIMMDNVIHALRLKTDLPITTITDKAINCHHNYVELENHYGENVYVTRKGAVRARAGDLGIIPGSMGAKSFIVRGKGNAESFNSCSHGAGRCMSRTEAKKRFTIEDHEKATIGVECRKDADVIDETPQAYKDIDAVMKAQESLVEIVYTLKQVICVKG